MTAPLHPPPGKGSWELDASHFPRPASLIAQKIYSGAFTLGLAESTRRYGLLLDRLAYEPVNGWFYNQVRIVGAPPGAPVPPKLIFQILTRLHPAIRGRARTAGKVFEDRPWRGDVERWHGEIKPQRIREHLGLLAVPIGTLTDAQLVEHLERCLHVYSESARIHGSLTIPSMLPVGDLIAHATQWTGLKPHQVLAALATSSPISAGREPTREALLSVLRSTPAALAILHRPDEPKAILEALIADRTDVGSAARAYIDGTGYRTLNSYDVLDPYALEVPFVVVEGLRVLVEREGANVQQRSDESLAKVRDAVPDSHRTAFDGLVAEARLTSSIRDERVLFNDYWSAGVTRRALLEAGRRLQAAGLIEAAVHATTCDLVEIRQLLVDRSGLVSPTPAERWQRRQQSTLAQMPMVLGPPVLPPPPVEWLPLALRRTQRATMACLAAIFDDAEESANPREVHGFGVSPGSYQGPARVVSGPADFYRLRPGDVLVARSTSPTFNVVLPMLGAIVTDRGGALSHAAIVSREFGIPGVVGCRNATSVLPDGATVLVNGTSGECRVAA
jgi:rifampicin phosphotransferase